MRRYRRKPIVVNAFRLGQKEEPTPVPEWFGSLHPNMITEDGILIPTLEGTMLARWGDWIIRGVKGEFYPCKPEIFETLYESVDE